MDQINTNINIEHNTNKEIENFINSDDSIDKVKKKINVLLKDRKILTSDIISLPIILDKNKCLKLEFCKQGFCFCSKTKIIALETKDNYRFIGQTDQSEKDLQKFIDLFDKQIQNIYNSYNHYRSLKYQDIDDDEMITNHNRDYITKNYNISKIRLDEYLKLKKKLLDFYSNKKRKINLIKSHFSIKEAEYLKKMNETKNTLVNILNNPSQSGDKEGAISLLKVYSKLIGDGVYNNKLNIDDIVMISEKIGIVTNLNDKNVTVKIIDTLIEETYTYDKIIGIKSIDEQLREINYERIYIKLDELKKILGISDTTSQEVIDVSISKKKSEIDEINKRFNINIEELFKLKNEYLTNLEKDPLPVLENKFSLTDYSKESKDIIEHSRFTKDDEIPFITILDELDIYDIIFLNNNNVSIGMGKYEKKISDNKYLDLHKISDYNWRHLLMDSYILDEPLIIQGKSFYSVKHAQAFLHFLQNKTFLKKSIKKFIESKSDMRNVDFYNDSIEIEEMPLLDLDNSDYTSKLSVSVIEIDTYHIPYYKFIHKVLLFHKFKIEKYKKILLDTEDALLVEQIGSKFRLLNDLMEIRTIINYMDSQNQDEDNLEILDDYRQIKDFDLGLDDIIISDFKEEEIQTQQELHQQDKDYVKYEESQLTIDYTEFKFNNITEGASDFTEQKAKIDSWWASLSDKEGEGKHKFSEMFWSDTEGHNIDVDSWYKYFENEQEQAGEDENPSDIFTYLQGSQEDEETDETINEETFEESQLELPDLGKVEFGSIEAIQALDQFEKILYNEGYNIEHVTPDGNCFYLAFVHQLFNNNALPDNYSTDLEMKKIKHQTNIIGPVYWDAANMLKKDLANAIEEGNKELLQNYFTEPIDEVIGDLRDESKPPLFAGDIHIRILAKIFNVNINIIAYNEISNKVDNITIIGNDIDSQLNINTKYQSELEGKTLNIGHSEQASHYVSIIPHINITDVNKYKITKIKNEGNHIVISDIIVDEECDIKEINSVGIMSNGKLLVYTDQVSDNLKHEICETDINTQGNTHHLTIRKNNKYIWYNHKFMGHVNIDGTPKYMDQIRYEYDF